MDEPKCTATVERIWREPSNVHPEGVHVVKVVVSQPDGTSRTFTADPATASRVGLMMSIASCPPEAPGEDPELPDVEP